MNAPLIESVELFLLRKGFTVKTLTRTCFDTLARNGSQILLIKILSDANAVTEQHAMEMHRISSYINATPLIVAGKAGAELEDNVVYRRMGIYTLNLVTFRNSVENKLPFIMSSKAGLTASVVGEKLKERREELGYSLNDLSNKIGVSARMISKYESGKSEITVSKAVKMYDICGHEIFNKIDIFSSEEKIFDGPSSPLTRKYSELGFNAAETRKVPFDIIAKREGEVILTEVGDKVNPEMSSLSRLMDADNLVIFDRKKPKDVPALTREEFLEFEKANELIKFLKGF